VPTCAGEKKEEKPTKIGEGERGFDDPKSL